MNKFFRLIILSFLIVPAQSWSAIEQDVIDQADRANEIKAASRIAKGTWLPIPIPVSNPTIGSGLQAALLYLHPQTSKDPNAPGATSGIMAMYTDTDTRLVGGFHDGSWEEDLYRFRIVAGSGVFNLDYFGSTADSSFRDNPVPYTIDSDFLLSQLLRRIPGTLDWYLGLRYMYSDANVVFDPGSVVPGLPPVSDELITSSLGLMLTYDSRNNNYYPTSGSQAEVVWMRDKETWGSDFEFNKFTSFYNYYHLLSTKDTLAFRTRLATTDGNVPFYLLPSLNLRGFAAGVYKDNSSISGHIEWRRKFLPRWGLMLFYEAGSVADSVDSLFQSETISSFGGGIRWQVSEDKKLNLGIDVGYSDGDNAIYIQVGEKF